jgi:HSP20 family protein
MRNQLETRKENRPRSFFDFLSTFDDSYDQSWMQPSFSRMMTNVSETDQGYILSIDMPGVSQQDIQIQIDGNILNLSAESQTEKNAKDAKSTSEQSFSRQYRKYQQSFTLPVTVSADKIEASYENGVLEVFLPKSPQSQPKKIEVQAGKGSASNTRLSGKETKSESSQKQTATSQH